MNIFTDLHHSSLFSSYLYTFEQRLGHNVYRQIGEDWFYKGYWKINRQKDTIAQYLATYGYQPVDGTPPLNNTMWVQDGVYYSKDPNTGQVHKAITFEKFMSMKWDIVIASIPQHIKPFKELAGMKKAKFIFQAGNNWHDVDLHKVDNLLASTIPQSVPCNHLFYKQEFDTNVFKPTTTKPKKIISNFMNVLHNYPEAYDLFLELERLLPDYEFRMYGSQNRDGCLTGIGNIAKAMQESMYIFHVKPGGDGYGHIVHNAFACGVPLITKASHYQGCLAGQMFSNDHTIMVDNMEPQTIARAITDREQDNDKMRELCYKEFTKHVDFSTDSENIQTFFETLRKL